MRKSAHGCHRAHAQVTLVDQYTFHGNTSLKAEVCAQALHSAPDRAIFTTTDTQGKPRPCLIYDSCHKKDFGFILGKEKWESGEGEEEEEEEGVKRSVRIFHR